MRYLDYFNSIEPRLKEMNAMQEGRAEEFASFLKGIFTLGIIPGDPNSPEPLSIQDIHIPAGFTGTGDVLITIFPGRAFDKDMNLIEISDSNKGSWDRAKCYPPTKPPTPIQSSGNQDVKLHFSSSSDKFLVYIKFLIAEDVESGQYDDAYNYHFPVKERGYVIDYYFNPTGNEDLETVIPLGLVSWDGTNIIVDGACRKYSKIINQEILDTVFNFGAADTSPSYPEKDSAEEKPIAIKDKFGKFQKIRDAKNAEEAENSDTVDQFHLTELAPEGPGMTPYVQFKKEDQARNAYLSYTCIKAQDSDKVNSKHVGGFESDDNLLTFGGIKQIPLDKFANPEGNRDMGGKKIINLADPSESTDAVTKKYIDGKMSQELPNLIKVGTVTWGPVTWTFQDAITVDVPVPDNITSNWFIFVTLLHFCGKDANHIFNRFDIVVNDNSTHYTIHFNYGGAGGWASEGTAWIPAGEPVKFGYLLIKKSIGF